MLVLAVKVNQKRRETLQIGQGRRAASYKDPAPSRFFQDSADNDAAVFRGNLPFIQPGSGVGVTLDAENAGVLAAAGIELGTAAALETPGSP